MGVNLKTHEVCEFWWSEYEVVGLVLIQY